MVIRNQVDERQDIGQIHFKDVYRSGYVVVVDDLRMELAELAKHLAVLDEFRRLARMEGREIRYFQVSLNTQAGKNRFHDALYVVEIVLFRFVRPFAGLALAVQEACSVHFLYGQLRNGQRFRLIDRSDFINAD